MLSFLFLPMSEAHAVALNVIRCSCCAIRGGEELKAVTEAPSATLQHHLATQTGGLHRITAM
jgi:hypothetical protein